MKHPQRPDGSNATIIGWILIVVGVSAGFFSGGTESQIGWLFSFAIANLGIALGVLLLSLGYLVRAIWFLPGRQFAEIADPASPELSSMCQWCDRDMSPYKACSAVSDEVNRKRIPRLRDETCKSEFRARGLIVETSEQ